MVGVARASSAALVRIHRLGPGEEKGEGRREGTPIDLRHIALSTRSMVLTTLVSRIASPRS